MGQRYEIWADWWSGDCNETLMTTPENREKNPALRVPGMIHVCDVLADTWEEAKEVYETVLNQGNF